MGDIKYVQQGDWQNVESSTKPVLVDFWAEWCLPCRMLAPTFERLAATYGDEISFAKVNVDELPEVAGQYVSVRFLLCCCCAGGKWSKSL